MGMKSGRTGRFPEDLLLIAKAKNKLQNSLPKWVASVCSTSHTYEEYTKAINTGDHLFRWEGWGLSDIVICIVI